MAGSKKEIIVLDARLVNLLNHAAFLAELENGHRFVAYLDGPDKHRAPELKRGAVVQVQFSPFDMSSGRITQFGPDQAHESKSVGKANL